MILKEALRRYAENFITVLGFALLLVFVLLFGQLSAPFISSGTVFLGYEFVKADIISFLVSLLSGILFIFFYSVLVVLVIFAIRKDLSKVKINYYLAEKVEKFAVKLFFFFAAIFIIASVVAGLLINLGAEPLLISAILFIIGVAFTFVPQSVVIDESSLWHSMLSNFEFMRKHPGSFAGVVLLSALLLLVLPLAEYAIDYVFFVGRFITLFLVLMFAVPYIEVLKTIMYMHKYELVKHSHREIKRQAR